MGQPCSQEKHAEIFSSPNRSPKRLSVSFLKLKQNRLTPLEFLCGLTHLTH